MKKLLIIGVLIMAFKLLGGGSDLNTVISDMNQNVLEMKGREVTEVFKDDTGTRRVILGKRGDDYGLFVSKPTFDVFNADNADLIFNSGQNVFKIVGTGTLNYTVEAHVGGSAVSNSAEETLDIQSDDPLIVMGFTESEGVYSIMPNGGLSSITADLTIGFVNYNQMYSYTSGGNLVVGAETTSFAGVPLDIRVRYYVLQETAN